MTAFSTHSLSRDPLYLLIFLLVSTFSTGKTQTAFVVPEGWKEIHNSTYIRLDLRYATTQNFTGEKIYTCGRCFLKTEAAAALQRAASILAKRGYGLILFDCYRPRPAQWKLWHIVPDPKYVADPREGSMHNRGLAVDISLFDLHTGQEVAMGTPYDFFGPAAHADYQELSEAILRRRRILREAMQQAGFEGIATEWWHFSLRGPLAPLAEWEWDCP